MSPVVASISGGTIVSAIVTFLLACAGVAAVILWRGKIPNLAKSLRAPYLLEPASLHPLGVALLLLFAYSKFKSGPPHGWVIAALPLLVLLLATGVSRRILYAALSCAMALFIGWHVFVDAQGERDASSDRDDAVESATTAFLSGSNAWSQTSVLGLKITTGPSSVLLAIPSVGLTGSVNTLTFLAWMLFLGLLLYGDVAGRNKMFPVLCILIVMPLSGFVHTMRWGLDELYYAAIASPFLWFAMTRGRPALAGAIGGFMVLSRLSYAPAVFAAGLWWLLAGRRTLRDILRLTIGGLLFVGIVIAIFRAVGGSDFAQENFLTNSAVKRLSDGDNLVAASLASLLKALPFRAVTSNLVVLVLSALAALGLRKAPHPFYAMSVGLFLAHTIAFSPKYPMDYQLTFLIPALYAVAFYGVNGDPRESGEKEHPPSSTGCSRGLA